MKVKVYNTEGVPVEEIELDEKVFGVKIKPPVLYQAVVAQKTNVRASIAHSKTRGEVRGGGRKPWRQKGTGRARHGSIRSPLWIGGGVVFGPRKDRSWSVKINKKMKRQAIRMALSDKTANERLIVVEKLEPEDYSTKKMIKVLNNLPCKRHKTLVAIPVPNPLLRYSLANLPYVETALAGSLNVVDLLSYEYLLTTKEGIDVIIKTFA